MSTSLTSPTPILSVIIVTYNPGEIVFDCLTSLSAACKDLPSEIIIVDNDSRDGTPEQIQCNFPQVRFVANPKNLGFAAANNIGLKVATGRYLLLLNPDVVVEPNALEQMVKYLRDNTSVGIDGPRTITGQGRIAHTANGEFTPAGILWQFWGLDALFSPRGFRRQAETSATPFEVTWLQACCMMFRREVYEAIGGLDEGFFMFCEEPDFCERAKQVGWRTVYFPQAKVTHFESTTVSRYPLLKMRHYHLSPLYYFRKRNQKLSVQILKFGFVAELSIKYGVRLLQQVFRSQAQLRGKIDAYPVVIKEIWRY